MNGSRELFSQKTPSEMFERVLNTPMAFVAEYLIAVVLNELKHLIDIVLRYYNAHKKRSLRDFNRFLHRLFLNLFRHKVLCFNVRLSSVGRW